MIKKLPTLKGIAAFFYVASHWGTISVERDEYRRQIKEREEWLISHQENLKRIHEIEKERMTKEFDEQLASILVKVRATSDTVQATHDAMRNLEEQSKGLNIATRQLMDLFSTAVGRLAIFYHLEPLRWQLEREHLKPQLITIIEKTMAKLPPRPPSPTLGLGQVANLLNKKP